jgi:putative hemolysin
MVFGLIGTIPEDGVTPELDGYGLKIKVFSIKDHRLENAIVYLKEDVSKPNALSIWAVRYKRC